MEKTVCKMFKWPSKSPQTMQPKNLSIHSISSESFPNDSLLSASVSEFPECSFNLHSSQDYSEDIKFISVKNSEIKKAFHSKVTDLKHLSKKIVYLYGEDIHTDTQSLINKSDKVSEVKNHEVQAEDFDGKSSNFKGIVENLEILQKSVKVTVDQIGKEKEELKKYFNEYEKLRRIVEGNDTQIEGDGTLNQEKTSFCQCFIV
jgi:uncharacterized coiled-coil DUF342 family protein